MMKRRVKCIAAAIGVMKTKYRSCKLLNPSTDSINVLLASLKPLHWVRNIPCVRFGNLSLFASYAMLMGPEKAETAVHGC